MALRYEGSWVCNSFILLVLSSVCLETNGSFVLAYAASSFMNSEAKFDMQMHARRKLDDITGAINIDCGISEDSSYADPKTDLRYISDKDYIDRGVNKEICSNCSSDAQKVSRSLMTVRCFPQGDRNCYILRPPEGKAKIYLIRASFMYGNYDDLNKSPQFSLYLGVNLWGVIKFDNASHVVIKEIIHVPTMDNIYVCLVNTGSGTPFISTLELRHFHDSTYQSLSGSLVLYQRLDFGSTSNEIVRYHDDAYDRIWFPYNCPGYTSLNTSLAVDSLKTSNFNLPSIVLQTAVKPMNANDSLDFEFDIGDPNVNFYVYMHFAEVESIPMNDKREFEILLNGRLLSEGVGLTYLESETISTPEPMRGAKLSISLVKLPNSTLPPILNAMEIYLVNRFWQQPTYADDARVIEDIKSMYVVGKNWQGDPCLPAPAWDGLNCSNDGYDPPRIVSLNLSSSGLTGSLSSKFSDFKALQHLDLSNNSLTGTLPESLSQLPDLITLNLERNKLSGSVPSALTRRSSSGSLTLRLDGNPELCLLSSCKEEEKNVVVPIVATLAALAAIFLALIILWRYKRRKVLRRLVKSRKEGSSLKSDSRQFTYAEIVRITNNFSTVIGRGGFGTVYHGYLSDGNQIAVKMLSAASAQGSIQFRTEAHLLMRIHHRNLASFIGYCYEGINTGIIYEYMACGNLEQYLADKSIDALSWKERLQIALDSAQGLQYLHNGCKPPIIHRDVKCANILLTENLEAKIADFGFSKSFSSESKSHMSTTVVGTVGYVDPEYYTSNRLTEKSDVYSFGIVLLELITGQPAIIKNHDESIHIVNWVRCYVEGGDIRSAVDPRLQGNFDTNSAWKFMEIAMSCVPPMSIQRPVMNHVVSELKECWNTEIGREQSSRFERQAMKLSSSFKTIALDLDTEMGPEAR